MKKFFVCLICLVGFGADGFAQTTYGQSGLLHMASADMEERGTLMVGTNYLNEHNTSTKWNYDTFNYYFNLTPLPWLEFNYTCTLFHRPLEVETAYFNCQDRHFGARLRVWKEGWVSDWTPQVVVGTSDPSASSSFLYNGELNVKKNGHFNRWYGAMSKHFTVRQWGEVGAHVGYVYGKHSGNEWNGVQVGANFQFNREGCSVLNGLNVMAEYDSRDVNVGLRYSTPWRINAMVELQRCKYVSAGVYCKLHLYK